jgi:hypothetical protein
VSVLKKHTLFDIFGYSSLMLWLCGLGGVSLLVKADAKLHEDAVDRGGRCEAD